jgi:hypothetical protein
MSLTPSDHGNGITPRPTFPAASVIQYDKKVLVALPWQKSVNPITSFCVSQLMDRRRTAAMISFGDAFVAHTRNSCADVFLESPCEWVLMIDDDMVVPFGDANWFRTYTGFQFAEKFMAWNAIDRLMSHKKTVIGSLYFGRHPGAPAVFNEGASDSAVGVYCRRGPHDEVRITKWVGTGCLLVHRSVFEAIERKFPRLARNGKRGGNWFTSTEASIVTKLEQIRSELQQGPLDGNKAYKALEGVTAALALAQHDNMLGFGEDVSFCMRAAAAGHPAHVDLGLICGHIGHAVYGPHNTGIR